MGNELRYKSDTHGAENSDHHGKKQHVITLNDERVDYFQWI